MRLIADGVIDRGGVPELARRLAYSERQINRLLVTEVGAGPLALARAQRAQTARVLIETTDLTFANIAFASGFASIRQFNDTIREVFAVTPTALRTGKDTTAEPGHVVVRLAARPPFDGEQIIDFLGQRAVPGVEEVIDGSYRRSLDLPHGAGVMTVTPGSDHVIAAFRLDDLRDLTAAVARTRRLFDLDADPASVAATLRTDDVLRPLITARPGLRVPGHPDGTELITRAVIGQQVSVAGARTIAARLAHRIGKPLDAPSGSITHRFPDASAIAAVAPEDLPMPRRRGEAVRAVAAAIADGDLVIDPGVDRERLREQLVGVPGIGPWTAEYVLMRAVGDPDAFMPTDLGVQHALSALGVDATPNAALARAERWRPWRAYANAHLWASLTP